jgi:cholesterol transport system auxiliary component
MNTQAPQHTLFSQMRREFKRCVGVAALALLAGLGLAGCGSLLPTPVSAPATYALDSARATAKTRAAASQASAPAQATTLTVSTPRAAPGYDSQRMAYTRHPHQLEYFARNEWVDTPARMLAPLMVAALQADAAVFVVAAPSAAASTWQLDTTVLRLQQNFNTRPSTVTLALRVSLTHNTTRRVVAWQEFEESVPTTADTPQAGVVAANRAVQLVMVELAAFCRAAITAP